MGFVNRNSKILWTLTSQVDFRGWDFPIDRSTKDWIPFNKHFLLLLVLQQVHKRCFLEQILWIDIAYSSLLSRLTCGSEKRLNFSYHPPIPLLSWDDMRCSSLIRPIYYCELGNVPACLPLHPDSDEIVSFLSILV